MVLLAVFKQLLLLGVQKGLTHLIQAVLHLTTLQLVFLGF
jgi:hypothetical protein